MKTPLRFLLCCVLGLWTVMARADVSSYVGVLQSPDNSAGTFDATDSFLLSLTLGTASNVTLQTYGFGGGVNGAGTTVSGGGTDPFVGLFSGTGAGAAFLNGTSLALANYSSGCPPAGTVTNFGATACGDVTLRFNDLAAGTYTILLSDGQYVPCAAVSAGCGTLGDGAADFTGGVFCNVTDTATGTACPNSTGVYALDVSVDGTGAASPVPEPNAALLLGTGVLVFAGGWSMRRRRPLLATR